MATYGFGATPGAVPFTGYTNTLGSGPANADATSGQVYFNGILQNDHKIAIALRCGAASKKLQYIWAALTGAVAGGNATYSKKQIQWQQGSPGGLIPIETVSIVNRVTTAADNTALQAFLTRNVFPATYAADVSGNGGGGKQTAAGGGPY